MSLCWVCKSGCELSEGISLEVLFVYFNSVGVIFSWFHLPPTGLQDSEGQGVVTDHPPLLLLSCGLGFSGENKPASEHTTLVSDIHTITFVTIQQQIDATHDCHVTIM